MRSSVHLPPAHRTRGHRLLSSQRRLEELTRAAPTLLEDEEWRPRPLPPAPAQRLAAALPLQPPAKVLVASCLRVPHLTCLR